MKKLFMILLAVLLLAGCASSNDPKTRYKNAVSSQAKKNYIARGVLGMAPLDGRDISLDLNYVLQMDKKSTPKEDDDVLYLDYSSANVNDPPYVAWFTGDGYVYHDYGTSKERIYFKVHDGEPSGLCDMADLANDLQVTQQDDLDVYTLTFDKESGKAAIGKMAEHLLFDALFRDLEGYDGIKEIHILEFAIHAGKDGSIKRMTMKGEHDERDYAFNCDFALEDAAEPMPELVAESFKVMDDYSGELKEYGTFNGGSYITMSQVPGIINIKMQDERYNLEYRPDMGVIVVYDVNDRKVDLAYYAPVSDMKSMFGFLVDELMNDDNQYYDILSREDVTMKDDKGTEHQGTRVSARSKRDGSLMVVDMYEDLDEMISYYNNCSEELFLQILAQSEITLERY